MEIQLRWTISPNDNMFFVSGCGDDLDDLEGPAQKLNSWADWNVASG